MQGYYENSRVYYVPQLELAATPLACDLRFNLLHWQPSVELLCVLRGTLTAEVEGEAYPMGPGDIITIDTYQAHQYYRGTEDNLCVMVTIDDALIHRTGEERLCLATVGPNALPKDDPVINTLRTAAGRFSELVLPLKQRYWHGEKIDQIPGPVWHGARAWLNRMVEILLEHARPATSGDRHIPAEFARCVEYIHAHYLEPCTAEQVARACGFSERSMRRLFQQYMEQSFGDYLTAVRLLSGRSLLENTDCTIAEAAAGAGLSVSSFYRLFKQATGLSPKEFQQQARHGTAWNFTLFEQLPVLIPRNVVLPIPAEQVDWDWAAGRKGWKF